MHIGIFTACRHAEDGLRDKQIGTIHFFRGPCISDGAFFVLTRLYSIEYPFRYLSNSESVDNTSELVLSKVSL